MSDLTEIPGGKPMLVKRELHFYWLLDTSGSMYNDGKIQALNQAIREAVPHMKEAAGDDARGRLIVHVMQFNDTARWVSAELAAGVPIQNFEWNADLDADGETYLGSALELLAKEMPKLPNNAFRPVIALVTDGQPTDNFRRGLETLTAQPWGRYAWKVAIAIGADADLDVCQQFLGKQEIRGLLKADNVNDIKKFIRFVSMVAAKMADKGPGPGDGAAAFNAALPVDAAVASSATGSAAAPARSNAVPPPMPSTPPSTSASPPPSDDWIQ
jgi:uncharacterized protein YegL